MPVPVPLGWVVQDLSLEAEPRAELYITPRGVPPSSPAYLFELYGGVRIVGMDLPPQYRGGFPRRRFLEIRKASIQRYEPPPYLEKKRCYALGAYECFEFTDRPLAAVATRIHVFAFNDNLPAGFEIFAVPPRGDGEAQAGLIPRILHRLQLPASTP